MEKEFLDKISITVPEFLYNNSIAYEISVKTDEILLSMNRSGVLTLQGETKVDLSTEFVNDVMALLEKRLDAEIERNKVDWYNLKYYYE